MENVKGLVNHDKGETLKIIVRKLEKCGYQVNYTVLTTLKYGIPQNRHRVYFVGIRNDIADKLFQWPDEISQCLSIEDFLPIVK